VKTASGASVNYSKLFSNLTNGTSYSAPGVSYTVGYSSSEINVTFSSVPEPAGIAVLGVILIALSPRRRPLNPASTSTFRRVRK
jgi:hypothetical protein